MSKKKRNYKRDWKDNMFRLWAKIVKNNKVIQDAVICNDEKINRTRKVYAALAEACYKFDLPKPIWLDQTIREFQLYDKTRFTKDHFVEEISFDFLQIEVIEEDDA